MMKSYRCRLLVTVLLSLGIVCARDRLLAQEMPLPGAMARSEGGIQGDALSRTMPVFPPESAGRGVRGVVVARILTALDGRMDRVDILQAPDRATGDAARAALMQWTFPPSRPTPDGRRFVLQSKVTFYFEIRGGRGVVLNPEEMDGNEDVWAAWKTGAAPRGGAPTVVRGAPTGFVEIDEAELRQRIATGRAVLVDVRNREPFTRSHAAGAVNMPGDEIHVRARAELDPRNPIVVDCSQDELTWCRAGAADFRKRGFDVSLFIP